MMKKTFAWLALAGVALAGLTPGARASGNEPGSLLVYPVYDNKTGSISIISVVNTNGNVGPGGNVAVEFIYINGDTCLEFNRSVTLTAKDSFTAVTDFHNPNADQGFVYAFAKSPTTGQAIAWDYLIGTIVVDSAMNTLGFETLPFVFKAGTTRGGPLPDRAPTNVDGDLNRDLNGLEYEPAPDIIMIPHFIGNNGDLNVQGSLALIGLTGIRFSTIVNFLVYNDNEEVFSAQRLFDCWEIVPLTTISGVFTDSFLAGTNNNPSETQGLADETGWYEINGSVAFSTAAQISSPAFLAMQIQKIGTSLSAGLPFTRGTQTNGDLLPTNLFGDVPAN